MNLQNNRGAPASWELVSSANGFGRVTSDNQLTTSGHAFVASGTASNANYVEILVDGASQGGATYSGGSWSLNLNLAAGSHTLVANATDASGLYTSNATSTFTVTAANASEQTGTVASTYDDDGNVITRSWSNGTVQTLTWDAQNRPVKISQRDSSNNGYDWTAVYDGIGRRISSTQQPIVNNTASGSATTITSEYDPLVEFLEIGVNVNGVKAWKVNTIDTNERYGDMQGAGSLEATIMDATGATTGMLNDYQGNGVATITGTTVTWNPARVGVYGFLPGNAAPQLTDATQLAQATVWKDHRVDPTGLVYFGGRMYDTFTQRWMSADSLGFAASSSLYEFCANDPLNYFDPDGRAPQGTYGFNSQGQLVFKPAPNFGPPVIECHGVSGGGFSGNINDFSGLTTIPGVSPLAADAYKGMANNIQQYGPPTLGKGSLLVGGIATGAVGGEFLAGLYETGAFGSGVLGGTVYVASNATLGAGLSATSNAVTQLIDTGTINTAELKLATKLGAGFGIISGGLGLWESSIEAQAAQTEARTAFANAYGRYLDIAEQEIDATEALALQTASNASALTGAIWWGDTFGSPIVESQIEDWLKAKLGIGENLTSGNCKGAGN